MKPQINRPEAVNLLNELRRLLAAGPPNARDFSYPEAPAAFINGDVVLTWFWGDVAKIIYTPGWTGDPAHVGPQWKTQIGYAPMPGAVVDGKLYQFNELSGKIIGIPKTSKKSDAAFAVLAYISDPVRSYATVDSSTTGSDPFAQSIVSRKADQWHIKIDQAFIDLIPTLMANGYPALYIPGSQEYYDAMDRHISEFLVNPKVKAAETLAAIESDWNQITDARGRDKQIAIWRAFVATMEKEGFRVKM
jgi:multiple sugar transport system substrate-binding protein